MLPRQYQPRRSLARVVRAPTWDLLAALAARVSPDRIVAFAPRAIARTLGVSDALVQDAVRELTELGAARAVETRRHDRVLVDLTNAIEPAHGPCGARSP